MSSSDVVAQSAFDVLRLGRSSQFIVARLLRFWTPKTSRRFLTNGHQNLNRSSVAGSTRVCNPGKASWSRVKMMPIGFLLAAAEKGQRFAMPLLRIALQSPAGAARGQLVVQLVIFKDLSRLKRFNSEEAIEYGLIIVRPPRIKDDAPLQDET
ncbi:hypothetical protein HID58_084854 [Brassica napus]|uniref:Uncharacterized protein n=1 Tax=Brassica napus TaxID=3708 RepID=A0ABQ7XL73_BRANA|nr:hypothetical protein HID58_084854 [Brassica napus]